MEKLFKYVIYISGADPGGVMAMGVKNPPLPESYRGSLKSGVVA